MEPPFSVFSPAYVFIDGRLDQFLGEAAGRAMAEVAGPLRAALVLYVMLYGLAILRGAIAEPMVDFALRSVKLSVICLLATTPAYGAWITDPLFHALPRALADAIAGSSAGDAGAAFDGFFARAAYLGQRLAQDGSAFDWLPYIVAGAVILAGAVMAALGFGVVILAKVALALLVSLGPIFVGCALFEATRRYFFGWLSQAVNYLVLFALMVAIFQLVLALVGERWSSIDGQDPVAGGLLFVALCVLGAILFLQTPAIAAGIAGGASLGLSDFGNALGLRASTPGSSAARGARASSPPQGGSIRQVRTTR